MGVFHRRVSCVNGAATTQIVVAKALFGPLQEPCSKMLHNVRRQHGSRNGFEIHARSIRDAVDLFPGLRKKHLLERSVVAALQDIDNRLL